MNIFSLQFVNNGLNVAAITADAVKAETSTEADISYHQSNALETPQQYDAPAPNTILVDGYGVAPYYNAGHYIAPQPDPDTVMPVLYNGYDERHIAAPHCTHHKKQEVRISIHI